MAAIQRRRGPNVIGFWGLLQPLADGLKLVVKEMLVPTRANAKIFVLAPMLILCLSLVSWSIIPFNLYHINDVMSTYVAELNLLYIQSTLLFGKFLENTTNVVQSFSQIANISYGILFLLAISSINVYGIIVAG